MNSTSFINGLNFIHHHLAVCLTIFTHHPHGDTNSDITSECRSGSEADTGCNYASKHFVKYLHVFLQFCFQVLNLS